MKRIGIIQILQESNSFNPVLTTLRDFDLYGIGYGNEVIDKYGNVNEIGGFLEGLNKWQDPIEAVGILRCQAWPGGPLRKDTKEWLVNTLKTQAAKAGKLDGVLFSLHGALVAEDIEDVDGLLLAELRAIIGIDVPIVATIDLHACCTTKMMSCADSIVAYHTSPHVDQNQTGIRAAVTLEKIINGSVPEYSYARLPMICISESQNTFTPPLASIYHRVLELETRPDILSAAILMTQGWLDVPQLGWLVMIVSDNNRIFADTEAERLADMCWDIRDQLTADFCTAEESVEKALNISAKPVIIADGADATNSGACGDSTHLLRVLANKDIPEGALVIMVDPEAVSYAGTLGEGELFRFEVGGKRDHIYSQPLEVVGELVSLQPANYVLSGHLGKNMYVNMGMSAIIKINDVNLLLVEHPGPGSTPEMYRCVGLEPKDFKIVVVKSPAGFRAEYEPFAAGIILSDCPGCATPHYERLQYTRINRPLWPLDKIMNRHETS